MAELCHQTGSFLWQSEVLVPGLLCGASADLNGVTYPTFHGGSGEALAQVILVIGLGLVAPTLFGLGTA